MKEEFRSLFLEPMIYIPLFTTAEHPKIIKFGIPMYIIPKRQSLV